MKTTITYIAIFTFLLIHTFAFSQETEGVDRTSIVSTKLDNTKSAIIQEKVQPQISPTPKNRIAAAELINYQAVARDAGGNVMTNADVAIDFEIRDGAGGAAVYNETQNLTTDDNGVFSAQIGSVTSMTGINWLEIEPWLQVSMNGTNVGETQMGSVPTALHSRQSGTVMLYGSGSTNSEKMIVNHSPNFTNWGIGYNDILDRVEFIGGGTKTASIALGSGNMITQGNVEINQTTTSPVLNRIYGNSVPIAYASVDSGGGISTGYGITSVTNSGVGTYDVVLDLDSNDLNTVVSITPFTTGLGSPEICGYETTGSNTFTVNIQSTGGVGRNSAFSFVVYGNH